MKLAGEPDVLEPFLYSLVDQLHSQRLAPFSVGLGLEDNGYFLGEFFSQAPDRFDVQLFDHYDLHFLCFFPVLGPIIVIFRFGRDGVPIDRQISVENAVGFNLNLEAFFFESLSQFGEVL